MKNDNVFFDVLSPVKFLDHAARIYPEKTAVISGEKKYTYKEFQKRVHLLAGALKTAGFKKGDKAAFISPNIPPLLEAHYAVPMLGGALVCINIRLSPAEVSYIINHSEAKFLFVDNEFAPLVSPVLNSLETVKNIINICDADDSLPIPGREYEQFLFEGKGVLAELDIDDEYELLAINYTSGTTGKPKGVMYHHRGAFLNALGEIITFGLDSESLYFWTLPMFHCNGWCFTWAVTAICGIHICLRKAIPQDIYENIEKHKVSHLCAAPTVLVSMAGYADKYKTELKRKIEIMTAGAPPAPAVIQKMESMGANITQTYGLTEVFGPHSFCFWKTAWNDLTPEKRAALKARQGVPYIHALHMDIVNPVTMEPVPADGETMGEIVMKGNNVMMGYYNDPEASAEAFAGGWFHSGDLAVRHPDGYIQIKDRKKDIIISGGENISTVEVENTLYLHPAVEEAAVIAVPHPKWGEVPKAFISLKEGEKITEDEIIIFCRENMAHFKAPKKVEFGPLPKTGTGKIMKYVLRQKEWPGKENMKA